MDTVDFEKTTQVVARVLAGIGTEQLTGPTPCPAYTVADVVDHVGGVAYGFARSARKQPMQGDAPEGGGSLDDPGWCERITRDLAELVVAWREPGAFDGVAQAGPVELPAPQVARVALNELVVHGWDLARSTGQDYDPDPAAVATSAEFVATFDAPADVDGGLFGPPVEVAPDAPAIDRLAGMTGRDPSWSPELSRSEH